MNNLGGNVKPIPHQVLDTFNALRAAGSVPNFAPDSPAEAAAVALYVATVMDGSGASIAEFKRMAMAHMVNPAHNPAFPLPWPSPGVLLSYRQAPQIATIEEADLLRVFRKLQDIAHDCGTITDARGKQQDAPAYMRRYDHVLGRKLTWDEIFVERVARQLGELSPAVEHALDAVGGRVGLTECARNDFDRGHLRKAFTAATRTAEAQGKPGRMGRLLQLPSQDRRQIAADEDVMPPEEVRRRIPFLRDAMRGGRGAARPVGLDAEAELERREALRAQRVKLKARGLV